MEPFNVLLARLDSVLKKFNPVNYERLYPPLPPERLSAVFGQLECDDEDMRTLFSWKGGFDPELNPKQRCMIFDFNSYLCSPDSMVYLLEDNEDDPRWVGPYLPLLRDDTGQFLIFNNTPGKEHGKIHLYSSSLGFIDEPISYYDSIPAMIETTIQAYEQGALVYDDAKDWLRKDRQKLAGISKAINRQSEYWKG
jgi:hypothetical protein